MSSEIEQFKAIINKFNNSPTSLEAYQAISDFVQAIFDMINFKAFARLINREHKQLMEKRYDMQANKQYYTNEERDRLGIVFHEIDMNFCLRNLHDVYYKMKPKNFIKYSDILFYRNMPDSPMPDYDKREYGMFMDKIFKKAMPFLTTGSVNIEKKFQEPANSTQEKMTENEMLEALGINESSKWEEIGIEFKDEYNVEIRANNKSYRSDYEKLGFADGRKNINDEAKPRSSWSLLNLFALKDNTLAIGNLLHKEREIIKKRKQELCKLLKDIFQLEEDPILYDKEKEAYIMRMKLKPEKEDLEQWQDRNIYEKPI